MHQPPWFDLHARNRALLPCFVCSVGGGGELLPLTGVLALPGLRRIAPVLLLCSEMQRQSIAEEIAAMFDGVMVEVESTVVTQATIGAISARWWRHSLGVRLQNSCYANTTLPRDVLTAVFDAVTIPADCSSLARTVGVSSEHLSRVMPRALGDALFTPKALLDIAVTMELFVRLGVGTSWVTIARDVQMSVRTLHRALLRTRKRLASTVRDYRALIDAVEIRRR